MKLRLTYTITGAIWGLWLGLLGAMLAAGLSVAVLWLFIFGDNPWPAGTTVAVGIFAALVGSALLIFGIAAGYALGRDQERAVAAGKTPFERARVRAIAALLVTVAASLAVVAIAYGRHVSSWRARAREQAVQSALAKRYQVAAIKVSPRADGSGFDITIQLRGEFPGQYRLNWGIREPLSRAVLWSEDASVQLREGERGIERFVPYPDLVQAYHQKVLKARAEIASVRQSFKLSASLAIDSPDYRGSQLFDVLETDLPVDFTVDQQGRLMTR